MQLPSQTSASRPSPVPHRDALATLRQAIPALAAIGLIGLIAMAVLSYRFDDDAVIWEGEAEPSGTLAVLPLRNTTGEPRHTWVELGLAEMIAETLVHTRGVQVLAPRRLHAAAQTRGISTRDEALRPRLRGLAAASGAELVLDGALLRAAPRRRAFALDLALANASTGEVLLRARLEGEEPMVLAERLTAALAARFAPGLEPIAMARVFSPSPFLNRLYAMATQDFRTDGPDEARHSYRLLLRYDPGFLEANARLAEIAVLEDRRRLAESLARETLGGSQGRGARRLQAYCLGLLGRVAVNDKRLDEAERLFSQALSIHEALGEPEAHLAALGDLAGVALARRDLNTAEKRLDDLLERRRQLGDLLSQATLLRRLGRLRLGVDPEEAARRFEAARQLSAEADDPWGEIRAIASLGDADRRRGDLASAGDRWRRALADAEQRGDRRRQLVLAAKLAEVEIAEGELERAEESYQSVLELALERGDEALEALASLRLAEILLVSDFPLQARGYLRRALELDRLIDDRLALQRAIARLAYAQDNFQLAADTQAAVQRQAGETWSEHDQRLLDAYRQALALGEQMPLPDPPQPQPQPVPSPPTPPPPTSTSPTPTSPTPTSTPRPTTPAPR